MITSAQARPRLAGFSLSEVIIALGIIAFAIPLVLAVQGIFSSNSSQTMNRGELASVTSSLQLYLNGRVLDPGSAATVSFNTVYGWVYSARQSPGSPKVIYGYKTSASESDYTFSQTAPAGNIDGRLLVAEILPPERNVLPDNLLVPDSASYSKACLPMKVALHILPIPSQKRTSASLVDSYPMVISR